MKQTASRHHQGEQYQRKLIGSWLKRTSSDADKEKPLAIVREGERGVQIVVDSDHIARSRLRVDTRMWLLSKLQPKIYGERLVYAGAPGHPVNVVTRMKRVIVNPADRDAGEA